MIELADLMTRWREAAQARGEDGEAYLREIESDPPCLIPWTHVLVDASGEVNVCCLSGATLGNVNNTPLDEVWNGERAQKLRENFLNHNYAGCSLRCSFILNRQEQGKKIGEAGPQQLAQNSDIIRREDLL